MRKRVPSTWWAPHFAIRNLRPLECSLSRCDVLPPLAPPDMLRCSGAPAHAAFARRRRNTPPRLLPAQPVVAPWRVLWARRGRLVAPGRAAHAEARALSLLRVKKLTRPLTPQPHTPAGRPPPVSSLPRRQARCRYGHCRSCWRLRRRLASWRQGCARHQGLAAAGRGPARLRLHPGPVRRERQGGVARSQRGCAGRTQAALGKGGGPARRFARALGDCQAREKAAAAGGKLSARRACAWRRAGSPGAAPRQDGSCAGPERAGMASPTLPQALGRLQLRRGRLTRCRPRQTHPAPRPSVCPPPAPAAGRSACSGTAHASWRARPWTGWWSPGGLQGATRLCSSVACCRRAATCITWWTTTTSRTNSCIFASTAVSRPPRAANSEHAAAPAATSCAVKGLGACRRLLKLGKGCKNTAWRAL